MWACIVSSDGREIIVCYFGICVMVYLVCELWQRSSLFKHFFSQPVCERRNCRQWIAVENKHCNNYLCSGFKCGLFTLIASWECRWRKITILSIFPAWNSSTLTPFTLLFYWVYRRKSTLYKPLPPQMKKEPDTASIDDCVIPQGAGKHHHDCCNKILR